MRCAMCIWRAAAAAAVETLSKFTGSTQKYVTAYGWACKTHRQKFCRLELFICAKMVCSVFSFFPLVSSPQVLSESCSPCSPTHENEIPSEKRAKHQYHVSLFLLLRFMSLVNCKDMKFWAKMGHRTFFVGLEPETIHLVFPFVLPINNNNKNTQPNPPYIHRATANPNQQQT